MGDILKTPFNSFSDDPSRNLWRFILGCVLDMFALPFLVASSISLYSKITRKETQGTSEHHANRPMSFELCHDKSFFEAFDQVTNRFV